MDFWEIFDRHYSRVHAYAASMLRDPAAGDDVVQETFIRAQANVDRLREPDKVLAWLLRIAHNLCMDQLRARQAARIDEAADVETAPAARVEPSVEADLERGEMSACVRDKVDQLPETDRSVILLYDISGLTHEEVAAILDIEVGAAKVRLHRARKKLRSLLERACSFEQDERNVLVCEPKQPGR
ncbi:MAG: polymerase, sigma-24 subunit, subfamily [Acidobacteria bacterium]|nr:polymerase, sigma-24 subunit, subfamily [Acidobacteriota bacterium]